MSKSVCEGFTSRDLSDIVDSLGNVVSSLTITRHAVKEGGGVTGDDLDGGLRLIELEIERVIRQLEEIPYRPEQDERARVDFGANKTMEKLENLSPIVGGSPEQIEICDLIQGLGLDRTDKNESLGMYAYILGMERGREESTS